MTRIDSDTITLMRTWEKGAAAAAYDHRVRTLESDMQSSFVELGLIIREVDEHNLWCFIPSAKTGEVGFHSLDAWIHEALPWSNGTAYSALGVARDCEDIPVEERKQIPRGNLETLRKLSPAVKRLMVHRAKVLSPPEFVAEIKRAFPEQHIEAKQTMKFKPTEGQREDIDAALALAVSVDGAMSREEALWTLANFYVITRPLMGKEESDETEKRIQ